MMFLSVDVHVASKGTDCMYGLYVVMFLSVDVGGRACGVGLQ